MKRLLKKDSITGSIPARTIVWIIAVWIFLALAVNALMLAGFDIDASRSFPVSIFNFRINYQGIPFLVVFGLLVWWVLKTYSKLNLFQIWLVCIAAVVLGNLGQGGFYEGFVKPYTVQNIQYLNDAFKIENWQQWLADFNTNQHLLLNHSQTHPPFAVLLLYLAYNLSGCNIAVMSVGFALVFSAVFLAVHHTLVVLRVEKPKRNLLLLLFAVTPAINIYGIASFEAIILMLSSFFVLAVIMTAQGKVFSIKIFLLMAVSVSLANLLTWGALFLFATAGLLALIQIYKYRNYLLLINLILSFFFFVGLSVLFWKYFGYNHLTGFFTASSIENPDGFRLFSNPLNYVVTRIEDIGELMLFLSFGWLALLFHPKLISLQWKNIKQLNLALVVSALVVISLMFLTGAYRTGETARAAIFLYAFLILTLVNAKAIVIKDIVRLAAIQTAVMQLFGYYYW